MDPQVSCGGGIDVVESWSREAYDLLGKTSMVE